MTHLLALALGVTIGVVVALRLVYGRPAPLPVYLEDDDGVQPADAYVVGLVA